MQSDFVIFPNSLSAYNFLQNLSYSVLLHVTASWKYIQPHFLQYHFMTFFCLCLSWELQSSLGADSAT